MDLNGSMPLNSELFSSMNHASNNHAKPSSKSIFGELITSPSKKMKSEQENNSKEDGINDLELLSRYALNSPPPLPNTSENTSRLLSSRDWTPSMNKTKTVVPADFTFSKPAIENVQQSIKLSRSEADMLDAFESPSIPYEYSSRESLSAQRVAEGIAISKISYESSQSRPPGSHENSNDSKKSNGEKMKSSLNQYNSNTEKFSKDDKSSNQFSQEEFCLSESSEERDVGSAGSISGFAAITAAAESVGEISDGEYSLLPSSKTSADSKTQNESFYDTNLFHRSQSLNRLKSAVGGSYSNPLNDDVSNGMGPFSPIISSSGISLFSPSSINHNNHDLFTVMSTNSRNNNDNFSIGYDDIPNNSSFSYDGINPPNYFRSPHQKSGDDNDSINYSQNSKSFLAQVLNKSTFYPPHPTANSPILNSPARSKSSKSSTTKFTKIKSSPVKKKSTSSSSNHITSSPSHSATSLRKSAELIAGKAATVFAHKNQTSSMDDSSKYKNMDNKNGLRIEENKSVDQSKPSVATDNSKQKLMVQAVDTHSTISSSSSSMRSSEDTSKVVQNVFKSSAGSNGSNDSSSKSSVPATHPATQQALTAVCNCRKSRCLKMYCDCFRISIYCTKACNCADCANIATMDNDRIGAIHAILERNPDAFKPKVTADPVSNSKGHLQGCHCRKSACLKKYCECFTLSVPCGERCRCVECKNTFEIYQPDYRFTLKQQHGGGSNVNPLLAGSTTKINPPMEQRMLPRNSYFPHVSSVPSNSSDANGISVAPKPLFFSLHSTVDMNKVAVEMNRDKGVEKIDLSAMNANNNPSRSIQNTFQSNQMPPYRNVTAVTSVKLEHHEAKKQAANFRSNQLQIKNENVQESSNGLYTPLTPERPSAGRNAENLNVNDRAYMYRNPPTTASTAITNTETSYREYNDEYDESPEDDEGGGKILGTLNLDTRYISSESSDVNESKQDSQRSPVRDFSQHSGIITSPIKLLELASMCEEREAQESFKAQSPKPSDL